uniref:Uncharacterized protein n=1 Tax=Arundo donax TaxID=35708 RepID=A0A0A9ESR8_ARUDO
MAASEAEEEGKSATCMVVHESSDFQKKKRRHV